MGPGVFPSENEAARSSVFDPLRKVCSQSGTQGGATVVIVPVRNLGSSSAFN